MESARTAKAEQTRAAIVSSALSLFREQGFDRTTMRAIAGGAGVSLGNAYYYFPSKEHLVQAYYEELFESHLAAARETLTSKNRFADRLAGVLEAWVDVAEPYHAFAGKFFKNAAEPSSPLSPFSAESAPTRDAAIGLMQQVIEGSDLKVSRSLQAELPQLLWLVQMGMVLFWVHDRSDGQARTRSLVRRAAPVIDRLLRATRLPGLKNLADDVVDLVKSLGHPSHRAP